jgi:hypothetical protein
MPYEKIPLGKAYTTRPASVKFLGKVTDEERIFTLERQVEEMMKIIMALRFRLKNKRTRVVEKEAELPVINAPHGLNKDGLPNELVCLAITEKQHFPVCMTIKPDGYQMGLTNYTSLSSAAEAISGVRRSGWTFWKLPDGRTLKEVFRR